MRSRGNTHDFAPEGNRQDLGAVEPCCAIEHPVYHSQHPYKKSPHQLTVNQSKEIYSQDGETFTNLVVCVLEFALHHGGINFYKNNTGQTRENHLAATPLVGQISGSN